ncbi:related to tRNA splicing endonuclease SEN2 [Ramularia collo-cygni]|uniref:tRNA-splicing endonuclease subunit Sen2 n=1 Tax=Ramularia collo-cygni TaxID=112498 RepID=A0A2D3VKE0_9PEZI|nr:related to tRNA splicing endonuclease SEN2 [Ramularia collo-cygni]CZT21483.1 related to tRNA splicing endonuclease SEN2 [Ramularia collo-cygni]
MSSATEPLLSNKPAAVPVAAQSETVKPKRQNHKPRPNYAHIHRQPLPLATHPLPAFHPTNPLSLLRLAYAYISQVLSPPSSHPASPYVGYYSPATCAIHITDPGHIRALWEMGFFGKGNLSRSEPSWMDREKARLQARRQGGTTAEEATNARRAKRRDFKLERARIEAEKIARQRDVEEGKISAEEAARIEREIEAAEAAKVDAPVTKRDVRPRDEAESDGEEGIEVIENQEHLQLTREETFFLSYGLGVLDVRSPTTGRSEAISLGNGPSLLKLFAPTLAPSEPFLINYAVYHHFRSLGWVVRPGIKFGVDYLLYYRGPVFSHAEFAIIVIPSYPKGSKEAERKAKDWWWLHCVNRVQSQVLKSLVLCYVDVPAAEESGIKGEVDIGRMLSGFKIREFVVRRWVANRMRD